MDTASTPIIATTSLSVLLHSALAVALFTGYVHTSPKEAVGQGLKIELISSINAAEQHEADVAHKPQIAERKDIKKTVPEKQYRTSQPKVLASPRDEIAMVDDSEMKRPGAIAQEDNSFVKSDSENESHSSVLQSTDARHNRHSILELLHSSISNNKKYPYLAQRQRREGITTIAFILHPDGTIENTRLINSSQTGSLDRAALTAVKNIEPFVVAKEYLEQSKEFRINVVFDLL